MTTYYVDCVTPRTTAAVWTADTVKAIGNRVWSTSLTAASAKYIYEATDIGSSPNKTHATTEPTWPTTVGNTVVDADITWTCRAPDSWDEALPGLQGAADLAVAGDIVYCRGTQTLSGAAIDFDTNGGTNAAGWIKFIGCNASGNVDGTRFVIDANGGSHHVTNFAAAADMVWMENIEVKNTGAGAYHGFYASAVAQGCVFINCCANTCGGSGFIGTFSSQSLFFRCVSYSNGATGFSGVYYAAKMLFCCSRDNSTDGFSSFVDGFILGCISHGNTDDGIEFGNSLSQGAIFNCVIDGNGDDGIVVLSNTIISGPMVFGCRITNHSGSGDIGLNCNSELFISGFNYFENNDGNNIQNATLHQFISIEGGSSTSNIEDQSNTNYGYVDPTNHDFSTNYVDSGNPDLRRTAITIPWS